QYEQKLADLESERHGLLEDKAQVDRYKQLLLKQRDIMIALTARLNERDESILALQEELDAYDKHQRLLEERVQRRTATLAHIQDLALSHHILDQAVLTEEGTLDEEVVSRLGLPPATLSEHEESPSAFDTYYGADQSGQEGGMTAQEKVTELEALLNERDADLAETREQLDTAVTSKAELEALLQDRLQSLLQSEIASRVTPTLGEAAPNPAVERALEEANQELGRLQAIVNTANKERVALVTIFEAKIKVMVDNIVRLLDGPALTNTRTIQKQARALQKLVNVSIAALRSTQQN
ncbi:hypothetical protein KIPB_013072, partial [Kipferlia bialata]